MGWSQNSESDFILNYFSEKKTGKFIDVGSYDVFRFSNVRDLYEKGGWGGVMVEPQPENFKTIYDHYKDDPKIQVLNIAVGEPSGDIDFFESNGDAVGTTDEAHMKKWGDAGVKYTKIKVKQVGVADFFNKYCKDVDFLSIDTEATNMTVFRNVPDFVWEQIKMVVIEHDNCQQEIEDKLEPFGLLVIHVNSENIILCK